MKRERVLRQRLVTQRLTSAPLATAAAVVRLLTCTQSQERDHAFFSLGLRTSGATYDSVRAEYDGLAFVRTHILRPTWHFVAPEDLRWILSLTSPRVLATMAARHRQLGLDDGRFRRVALDALAALLQGGNYLTRNEIGGELGRRDDLPRPGEQLGHLLLVAELEGLVCSGPMRGVHHSYALTDEVVAPTPALDQPEAVARLAHRFFAGHGPASIKDFTRWSSLTVALTKVAIAELGDALAMVEVDGAPHWFDPQAVARRRPSAPSGFLFPAYDEAVLTYPALNFEAPEDHPYAEHPDPFWAMVVVGERNVGLWKRTVRGGRVTVEVWLASSLGRAGRQEVERAAQRMARFLERDLVYVEGSAKPHLWGGDSGHPARRPRRADRA